DSGFGGSAYDTCTRLSGAEKTGSCARGGRASAEACAQVCRCQGIARAFAEGEAFGRRTMSAYRLVPKFYGPRIFAASTLTFLCGACIAAAFLGLPTATADEPSANAVVVRLHLDRVVAPVLATYMDEGIADAANRHAALVLITMDTPGGLSDSMTDIIQHILTSTVPVAV